MQLCQMPKHFWEMLHNEIFYTQAVAHCGTAVTLLLYKHLVCGSLDRARLLIKMINVCFSSKLPTRQSFSTEQKFMAELSPLEGRFC